MPKVTQRWLGFEPRSVAREPSGLAILFSLVGTYLELACWPSKGAGESCPGPEVPLVLSSPLPPIPCPACHPSSCPSKGGFDGLFAATPSPNRRGEAGGPRWCCCLPWLCREPPGRPGVRASGPGLPSPRWASPVHPARKANRPWHLQTVTSSQQTVALSSSPAPMSQCAWWGPGPRLSPLRP